MAIPPVKLPPYEAKAISMAAASLQMQDIDPSTSDEYALLKEAYTKKQLQEPEQARLRSQFRRYDHFYNPNTLNSCLNSLPPNPVSSTTVTHVDC